MEPKQDRPAFWYCKESEVQKFPDILKHELLPIIFMESGEMPNRKGKGKSCIIVVNAAGVFLLRPKSGVKQYPIGKWMSVWDVLEARYVNPRRRVLISQNGELDFWSDHARKAMDVLIAVRKALYQQTTDKNPIRMVDFPEEVQVKQHANVLDVKLLLPLRYVSFCVRYNEPVDNYTLAMFKNVGSGGVITLDEKCVAPAELKVIIDPLIMGGWYRSVILKNYAPQLVGRIVHFMLKHTSIQTMILEGYSALVPSQLQLDDVVVPGQDKPAMAFVFRLCNLGANVLCEFWQQLMRFQGQIQRITFMDMDFPRQALVEFENLSRNAQSMKTVEKLEFIRTTMVGVTVQDIDNFVVTELSSLRFLQNLTCSQWPAPQQFQLMNFRDNSFLSEVVLIGQDFMYDFQNIVLPPSIYYLNFSRGKFNGQSLVSFLSCLSEQNNHLTVVLSDLVLSERDWSQVYSSMGSIPRPRTIQELDWSGNSLPQSYLQTFAEFFLMSGNPMRFLCIDRIFDRSRLDDLRYLVECIQADRLWGLSISGGSTHSLGGCMSSVFQIIERLTELHILYVDNHNMSADDRLACLQFAGQHPNIVEFSMDGTDLPSEEDLYKFYKKLFDIQTLQSIGRPDNDFARMFRITGKITIIKQFRWLRTQIQARYNMTPQIIRAYYLCRMNTTGAFSASDLHVFAGKYPGPLFDITQTDAYGLKSKVKLPRGEQRLLTLRRLETRANVSGLSEIQNSCLETPMIPPVNIEDTGRQFDYVNQFPGSSLEQRPVLMRPDFLPPGSLDDDNPPVPGVPQWAGEEVITVTTQQTYTVPMAAPEVPCFIPPPPPESSSDEEVITTVTTQTFQQELEAPPVPMFIPPPPPSDDSSSSEETITVVKTQVYEQHIQAPVTPAFIPPPPPEEDEPVENPIRRSGVLIPVVQSSDSEEEPMPVIEQFVYSYEMTPTVITPELPPEIPEPQYVQPEIPVPQYVQPEIPEPQYVQPEIPQPVVIQQEIPAYVPPMQNASSSSSSSDHEDDGSIFIPPPISPPPQVVVPPPAPPVVEPVAPPPLPPTIPTYQPPPVTIKAVSPPPPVEEDNSALRMSGGLRVSGGIRVPPVRVIYTQPGQILPPEPAPRKNNSRMSRFESAAGVLRLPTVRTSGPLPSLSTKKVLLANGETTEVPDHTSLGNQPQVVIRNPLVHPDIDDVTTFSKKTVRATVPTIELPESTTYMTLDEFYAKDHFQIESVNAMARFPNMQHPLMYRQKIVHPEVKILGVPEVW